MQEAEAREILSSRFDVSRETMGRLSAFVGLLEIENQAQNLVSRGTIGSVWARHILDSAQLIRFASPGGEWLDLGTGAGFPGLIVGLLGPGPVTLVEERRKRADFLTRAVSLLGLEDKAQVHCAKIERLPHRKFDVISARAFAPLGRLFELSHSFSTTKTVWILPKGRNARSELEAVQASWQGEFRLEPSITDTDAQIIVAEGVRPRPGVTGAERKGGR